MQQRGFSWSLPGLVLLIVLSACKEKKEPPREQREQGNQPILAEGFIVKTTSLSENIEVPGTLLPFEATEIRPEISGRVVSLNIPEGSFVKQGALLVKLFDGDLQAQLQKLQVQLQIAQKTSERYRELLKIQGVSQQEADLSELEVSNLKADIELVKVNIGKTEIRAPFDGRIGLKYISNGAYISPTILVTTISQTAQLKMNFSVPEKYSGDMTKGRPITFSIAGSDRKFNATVIATESLIEANTRTLRVLTVIKETSPLLVPGAFAKVSLSLGKNDKALIIPTQAVIPQARNKQAIVYRDGVAKFENIVTGIRDSSYVEVTSGVKLGDTVLTTALLALQPDSKVKLTKVQ